MKSMILSGIITILLCATISADQLASPESIKYVDTTIDVRQNLDTFVATYDFPINTSATAEITMTFPKDSMLNYAHSNLNIDSNCSGDELIRNPGSSIRLGIFVPGERLAAAGKPENMGTSIEAQCITGTKFLEGDNAIYQGENEIPITRLSKSEIPLPERFIARSLDRNFAVNIIIIDGGGPVAIRLECTQARLINQIYWPRIADNC